MSATATTVSTLNGYFKTKYGKKQMLVPEWAVVQGLIPFNGDLARVGANFQEVIFLRRALGYTLNGGVNLGNAFTVAAPVALETQPAVLTPYEILLNDKISYGAMVQARSDGEEAFGNSVEEVLMSMDESHRFIAELIFLYGQTGFATYTTVTPVDATHLVLTIASKDWAPGTWSQAENLYIDVYNGTTKINTTAAIQVQTVVSQSARTVAITGAAADITAITGTTNYTLHLVGAGGTSPQAAAGINKILTNSGSLFGIDASVYGLWKGTTVVLPNAPLTLSGIHGASTSVVNRGGYGELVYLINPFAWQDLSDDQAALRRYASSTKTEMQNGTDEIVFWGTNGKMSFKPHPMVNQGDGFGIMPKEWVRGGATDITSGIPGASEDMFFDDPSTASMFLRNYSSQFIYCRKPARQVKISGIVSRSAP
jgi:hypothetical protein